MSACEDEDEHLRSTRYMYPRASHSIPNHTGPTNGDPRSVAEIRILERQRSQAAPGLVVKKWSLYQKRDFRFSPTSLFLGTALDPRRFFPSLVPRHPDLSLSASNTPLHTQMIPICLRGIHIYLWTCQQCVRQGRLFKPNRERLKCATTSHQERRWRCSIRCRGAW